MRAEGAQDAIFRHLAACLARVLPSAQCVQLRSSSFLHSHAAKSNNQLWSEGCMALSGRDKDFKKHGWSNLATWLRTLTDGRGAR